MDEGRHRIEVATQAIVAAQQDVTGAIAEITGGDRADKRHASERLRSALDRLRVAQRELASLEDLLRRHAAEGGDHHA